MLGNAAESGSSSRSSPAAPKGSLAGIYPKAYLPLHEILAILLISMDF